MTIPRNTLVALSLFAAVVTGCPEPVPQGAKNGQGQSQGGGAGGVTPPPKGDGAPTGGEGGAPVGDPEGQASAQGAVPVIGTFAGEPSEASLEPLVTQDDIDDGVTIAGTISCADCVGKLLLRVLPPPPESGDDGADKIQLVTFKLFDSAGPFSIKVPKGTGKVVLQVIDDSNGDGIPTSGERMGMPTDGPVAVGSGLKGVSLAVGSFPSMPEQQPPEPPTPGDIQEGTAPPDGPPIDGAKPLDGPPIDGAKPLDGPPVDGPPTDGK